MAIEEDCIAWARDIGEALLDAPIAESNLSTGHAGVALFLAYLAQVTQDPRFTEAAEAHLATAIEDAGNGNPYLYSGSTGVAWVTEHICGPLLSPNEDDINADTDSFVDAVLDARPFWAERYELMYGLAGLGVYLLERPASATRDALLGKLLADLGELGQPDPTGEHLLWSSKTDPRFPDGGHNLGLAHGSAGLAAFLARLLTAGIATDTVAPMLRRTIDGLRHQRSLDTRSLFPSFIENREEWSRLAWCYGDLAVAFALLAAGQALGDPSLVDEATTAVRHASARDAVSAGIIDVGICHGAMGLAHMFGRFHAHVPDPAFAAAADRWLAHAFSLRAAEHGLAGIRNWQGIEQAWESNPGLLVGVSGVGLALLTRAGVIGSTWDRVFLLH